MANVHKFEQQQQQKAIKTPIPMTPFESRLSFHSFASMVCFVVRCDGMSANIWTIWLRCLCACNGVSMCVCVCVCVYVFCFDLILCYCMGGFSTIVFIVCMHVVNLVCIRLDFFIHFISPTLLLLNFSCQISCNVNDQHSAHSIGAELKSEILSDVMKRKRSILPQKKLWPANIRISIAFSSI